MCPLIFFKFKTHSNIVQSLTKEWINLVRLLQLDSLYYFELKKLQPYISCKADTKEFVLEDNFWWEAELCRATAHSTLSRAFSHTFKPRSWPFIHSVWQFRVPRKSMGEKLLQNLEYFVLELPYINFLEITMSNNHIRKEKKRNKIKKSKVSSIQKEEEKNIHRHSTSEGLEKG